MKTCILVYDQCAMFEVILAFNFLKHGGEVLSVGQDLIPYNTLDGIRVIPHKRLSEIDFTSVDLMIIPGGDTKSVENDPEVLEAVKTVASLGKNVAAICGGPRVLANAGLLQGKHYTAFEAMNDGGGVYTDENVTMDENVITAKGNAYVDFALKLGEVSHLFTDEADYQETVRFFREFRAD